MVSLLAGARPGTRRKATCRRRERSLAFWAPGDHNKDMADGSSGSDSARSPQYCPLVLVAIAVCAGMAWDRYWPRPVWVWWALCLATGSAWLALWWKRRERAASWMLLMAATACGASWHHCQWFLFARDDLGFAAGPVAQPVCVQGWILQGPRRLPALPPNPLRAEFSDREVRFEVQLCAVRDGRQWVPATGRARLVVSFGLQEPLVDLRPGDRFRAVGRLVAPRQAMNPGEFDAAAYARGDRRLATLHARSATCLEVLERAGPGSWRKGLDTLRRCGRELLRRHIDPAQAGLAAAVLLGLREEVGFEQTEAFMVAGAVHVLSISGFHVAILASALMAVVRLLVVPRRLAMAVLAGVTVLYTLLTDAEPPAVRAAILVLVFCIGTALGRPALGLNAWALGLLVVVGLSPADLFRTGPQLSFLSVLALSWANRAFRLHTDRQDVRERLAWSARPWMGRVTVSLGRWLGQMTVLALAVWLVTLPLVMARFHLFSPAALVVGTVLWAPMAAALWTGFGLLAVGAWLPGAGTVLGWCCRTCLAFVQWALDAAAGVPGSHFWVPGPSNGWLAGLYGGAALVAAGVGMRLPRRWTLALASAWIAIGLAPGWLGRVDPTLRATFLAMEHGCAVVLRLPGGSTVLYDAGRLLAPDAALRTLSGALWHEGITRIDALILSHADADHFNAVPGLLDRFAIKAVFVPERMFQGADPAVQFLHESLGRHRVPIHRIAAGASFEDIAGCRIHVLHPPVGEDFGSDNANAMVLSVEYAGRSILLTGDISPPGLNHLLAQPPRPCTVLLAPHHGSLRSNPPGLADWCSSELVVISGSRRFATDRSWAAYQAAGAKVLHTAHDGAVLVAVDALGRWTARTFVTHGR